ncbi:MAG: hypothetical protein LDL31_08505, partial [Prosthecobacter sp.]|nr:hypothetical protein [Prosthecobacter sp.]
MNSRPYLAAALCLLASLDPCSAAPGDVDGLFLTNVGVGITGSDHPNPFPTGAQNAVALQPGGKIIVGGARSRFNDSGELTVLKRLNADGTLDTSFLPGVDYESGPQVLSGGDAEINAILMNPDGSFFIGGVFENYGTAGTARMCVARVNADGTLDEGFVPPASISAAGGRFVLTLGFAPNGDLLVGGRFGVNLYRLNPTTGAQISITNSVSGTGTTVYDVRAGSDGRIYVSGASGGGLPMARRLFLDGSLDPSFQVQFQPGEFGNVNKILPLPDGRVVLGGGFMLAGSTADDRLACLLSDGRVDTAFRSNLGTGPNGWAGGVLQLLPTGEILNGGIFSNFNGADTASLAVLRLDGTRNASFTPVPYTTVHGSYGTHIYSAAVQGDGRLVAAGWFTRVTDPDRDIRNLVRFDGFAEAGNGSFEIASAAYQVVENAGQVSIQVTRLPGVTGAVSVDYATGGGTAVAGTDYTATSGTLNWAAGEGGAKTVTIPVLNNSQVDAAPRTLNLSLSNATGGATIGVQGTTTVTILDDEGAPVITQQPQNTTVFQGQSFTLSVSYTVNRSASVSWQRFNGTTFEAFPGGNTPTLTVAGADPATHGGQWRVVVSHATGSATSNPITVTVLTPDGSLIPSFNSSA